MIESYALYKDKWRSCTGKNALGSVRLASECILGARKPSSYVGLQPTKNPLESVCRDFEGRGCRGCVI
jgi:hypothetical protein